MPRYISHSYDTHSLSITERGRHHSANRHKVYFWTYGTEQNRGDASARLSGVSDSWHCYIVGAANQRQHQYYLQGLLHRWRNRERLSGSAGVNTYVFSPPVQIMNNIDLIISHMMTKNESNCIQERRLTSAFSSHCRREKLYFLKSGK